MTTEGSVFELDSERVPLGVLLRDVARHADLLPLLALQEFRGKFRAARLGIAWSGIQPLLRGAVLAFVFTRLVRIPTRADVPYAAFILAGTGAWGYLMTAVTEGTTSIMRNGALAGRVYFPRLLLPAMPAASTLPSYAITLVIVVIVSVAVGVEVDVELLALPLVVLLGVVLAVSISLPLSVLHVYFRDVGPLVSAIMGIAFYATPVIYPLELAERAGVRWLLEANPFTGAIAALRWSVFGGREDVGAAIWWTLGWSVAFTAVGLATYRRHERVCVDRL